MHTWRHTPAQAHTQTVLNSHRSLKGESGRNTLLSSFVLDLRSKGESSPNSEVTDPPHLCVHLFSSSIHLGQLPGVGGLPKLKWAAGHQSTATQQHLPTASVQRCHLSPHQGPNTFRRERNGALCTFWDPEWWESYQSVCLWLHILITCSGKARSSEKKGKKRKPAFCTAAFNFHSGISFIM